MLRPPKVVTLVVVISDDLESDIDQQDEADGSAEPLLDQCWQSLPGNLFSQIMSHLPLLEQCPIRLVCRRWCRLVFANVYDLRVPDILAPIPDYFGLRQAATGEPPYREEFCMPKEREWNRILYFVRHSQKSVRRIWFGEELHLFLGVQFWKTLTLFAPHLTLISAPRCRVNLRALAYKLPRLRSLVCWDLTDDVRCPLKHGLALAHNRLLHLEIRGCAYEYWRGFLQYLKCEALKVIGVAFPDHWKPWEVSRSLGSLAKQCSQLQELSIHAASEWPHQSPRLKFTRLAGMTQLRKLDLTRVLRKYDPRFLDDFTAKTPFLETLLLGGRQALDDFDFLDNCRKQLRQFSALNSASVEASLSRNLSRCRRLWELSLFSTTLLSCAFLRPLTRLTHLTIRSGTGTGSLCSFTRLLNLTHLDMSQNESLDDHCDLKVIPYSCPRLSYLNLSGCRQICDFKFLKYFRTLTHLLLADTTFDESDILQYLSTENRLEYVDISGTPASGQSFGFFYLGKFPLKALRLARTSVPLIVFASFLSATAKTLEALDLSDSVSVKPLFFDVIYRHTQNLRYLKIGCRRFSLNSELIRFVELRMETIEKQAAAGGGDCSPVIRFVTPSSAQQQQQPPQASQIVPLNRMRLVWRCKRCRPQDWCVCMRRVRDVAAHAKVDLHPCF